MRRSPNVATPAAAATVRTPYNCALWSALALRPMATVIVPVNVVAILPPSSSAETSTGGVIVLSGWVLLGSTVNRSCDATPGVMSKVALVAPASPGADAVKVYCPALLRRRSANRAMPPLAGALSVPEIAAPAGWSPSAIVIVPLKPVNRWPSASSAVTSTAGELVAPAAVLVGGREYETQHGAGRE